MAEKKPPSPPIFVGPTSEPVGDEERDTMIGAVAERVVRMGMAVPAIFFLESSKPLSYVGSQVMVFFGPFVQSLFSINRYYEFAALMEDRGNVERLLIAIETREEERARAEREEKDRRKAEKKAAREARSAAGPGGAAGKAGTTGTTPGAAQPGLMARLKRRIFPGVLALLVATGIGVMLAGVAATTVLAEGVLAPSELTAADTPNDGGRSITLHWTRSPDDGGGRNIVTGYRIERATSASGPFESVGNANAGGDGRETSYTDATVRDGVDYWYRVVAIAPADTVSTASTPGAPGSGAPGDSASIAAGGASVTTASPARASGQWFNRRRLNMLVAILVLAGSVLYFLRRAESGAKVYLRPVAGLKAFEDGVGRATEMGRKVLYIPGINDMDQVETVAGVLILGHVAKMTAAYETPLEVPVSRSLVMATAREVTQQAYLAAGRPDLYDQEMVHYITDEQFAYAAAVNGIMLRDKPGTVFYQGKFFAESLILAETGNSIGAIQIAGTASPAQLPFFVTACDYTLIGEELFAASAYLSRDPRLIGSIKGQDVGKIVFVVAIVAGIVIETLNAMGVTAFSLKPLFQVR